LDQSRKQAEDLEGRELEMRRKVEQMHVERDLAMKSEEKTFGIADSIEHNFIKAEINLDGTIAIANRKFLEVMHYLPPEIEGKHFSMFLEEKDLGRFDTIWARLVSGGNYYEEEVRYITRHSRIWFHVIFTPLRDKLGIINRILFTGFNIDENKTKQITEKAELTAIENSLLKAEYKGDGTIIATNNLYLETIGFSRAETHHQNLFSFIEEDLKPEFSRLWEKVLNGTPSTYLDRIITKKKQEKFFKGVYTSVVDTDGIISKIVYLGLDITEEIENPEKAEVASNQIIDNSKVKEEEIPKKREIKNQKKYQNLFEEDYIDSDEF
jgi:methyl-accepting chemotaxis protein